MCQKKNGQILCAVILIVVLALFLSSFAIINFIGFPKFCTFDMYEDTAYSMLAWEAKSIFPKDWVFGNQYYVVATPVLCALFYGLTGNINFAMALATMAMTLLVMLSMLFLIHPFTDKLGRLTGMAAMIGCMITANAVASLEGQLFYILASYYSCYLITVLIVMGDYLHALCFKNKRGFSAALILSMALCFTTGMQSLRITAVLILPVLATEILRILILLIRKEKNKIKRTWAVTLRALLYTFSNFLGAIFIKVLNVPNVTIYGSLSQRNLSSLKDAHEVNMRILKKITGFYYACTEENGWIYFILASFFTAIVILAAFLSLYRYIAERKKGKSGKKHLFGAINFSVFAISIAGLFAMNLVFDMNFRTPYLFIWYPFTAISCVVLLQYLKPGCWKIVGILLLCIGCIGNWYVGYAPAVQKTLEPYDANIYRKMSDYIVESGFSYVYGDICVTSPIAAYSNGQVLAASSFEKPLEILTYINPQGVYGEDENSKAVYIFYCGQNIDAEKYAEKIGASMTLIAEFEGGYYTLYTSDKQLMHYGEQPSESFLKS